MSDHLARVQLVMLEVDRVKAEADRRAAAGDLDGVIACRNEMDVLLESMRGIRREQLLEGLQPRRSGRPPWWAFWRNRSQTGRTLEEILSADGPEVAS